MLKWFFSLSASTRDCIMAVITILSGLIIFCNDFISTFIGTWQRTGSGNTVPAGRKEKIGEVDDKGYKQIEHKVATGGLLADLPVNVASDKIVVAKGKGKLKPVANTTPIEPGQLTADEVLKDLNEAIAEEEKNL